MNLLSPLSWAGHQAVPPQEWIVDTDVGPDDVLALLYLLNQPQIKIKAITIEGNGNTHCKPAFANIKGILQLASQPNIPVACGRATPLQGNHQFPQELIKKCDNLGNTPLATQPVVLPNQSAKTLFLQTLRHAAKPINILAIGPLTTLAEVFEQQPRLKTKVHMIYIMGGAIRVSGNIQSIVPTSTNQVAEWNIYIDPYAAEKLFHSGVPLTLVPLDATNQALLNQDFYQQLQKKRTTAVAAFAYSLLQHHKQLLQSQNWYFWDPMAAVIATDETLAHIKILPLSVRAGPESLSGATIIDPQKGAKIRACIGIAVQKFKEKFLTGLAL